MSDIAPPNSEPVYRLFALQFQMIANSLAARYGCPVWLVGGALVDPEPRDYDVRLVLSPEDHERCFGKTRPELEAHEFDALWDGSMWRRAYDQLKQSRLLSSSLRRNIDLQFYLDEEVKRYGWAALPRARLDRAPPWMPLR